MVSYGYTLSSEEHDPLRLVADARRAEEVGFRQAVAERDGPPYDDRGPSTHKG